MRARRRSLAAALVLTAASAALPGVAGAQDPVGQPPATEQASTPGQPPTPYATVTVTVGAAHPFSIGSLDEYWDARTGGQLAVHTPFHVGEVGAFVTVLPHVARAAAQPDFRAYVIGLEWGIAMRPASRIRPFARMAVGGYLASFAGVETKGLARESEILLGGEAGVAATIVGRTSLVASATGLQVLTSTPIRTGYVTLGLAQALDTPAWLRGILQ